MKTNGKSFSVSYHNVWLTMLTICALYSQFYTIWTIWMFFSATNIFYYFNFESLFWLSRAILQRFSNFKLLQLVNINFW